MNDHATASTPLGRRGGGPLLAIIRRIDRFAEISGWVVSWLVVPLIAIMVIEVISRYALRFPTPWTYDLTYMLTGTLFMLGAAYTLRRDGHIRTDFLYKSFPVRWQGLIDSIAYLFFFFPGIGIFMWFGWETFFDALRMGERSISPWNPPLYPYRAVIPLAGLFLLIQGVSEVLKSLHALFTGRWP
ncbi:TRAP transporter small permease subunit [Spiribacter halobius]|nr:TRAP transporter small permease subunit [Spiribacter halobius]UEX79107.1 TRAP transporter small permease subunit [Spiribacter halobius]